MTNNLINIFFKSNFSLFIEFIRFVRRPDRESFLRNCNDLLGPDHSKVIQRPEKEMMSSASSESSSGWTTFSSSPTSDDSDGGCRR